MRLLIWCWLDLNAFKYKNNWVPLNEKNVSAIFIVDSNISILEYIIVHFDYFSFIRYTFMKHVWKSNYNIKWNLNMFSLLINLLAYLLLKLKNFWIFFIFLRGVYRFTFITNYLFLLCFIICLCRACATRYQILYVQ